MNMTICSCKSQAGIEARPFKDESGSLGFSRWLAIKGETVPNSAVVASTGNVISRQTCGLRHPRLRTSPHLKENESHVRSLNFDPTELESFTDAVRPHGWKVFEDDGALVASNGDTHFYIRENEKRSFTIETNDRNPVSQKGWEAELATSSFALRYLLITLSPRFPDAHANALNQLMHLKGLPPAAQVTPSLPTAAGKPPTRDDLFVNGTYVGTFKRLGLELHYAGLSAGLMPLTVAELATFFANGGLPNGKLPA